MLYFYFTWPSGRTSCPFLIGLLSFLLLSSWRAHPGAHKFRDPLAPGWYDSCGIRASWDSVTRNMTRSFKDQTEVQHIENIIPLVASAYGSLFRLRSWDASSSKLSSSIGHAYLPLDEVEYFLPMTWTNWSGYEKHLRGKAPRPVVGDLVAMKCHFPASHWRIIYPHNGSLILSQEVLKKFRSFEDESRRWGRALSPITSILLVSCVGTSVDSSRRMKMSFEENFEQLPSRYHSLALNA